MAQRNPMNERYTVEGNMPGKTRRSASSAKPKTKAASTVMEAGKGAKKGGKGGAKSKEQRRQERAESREERAQIDQMVAKAPKSPRYRMLRKIWAVSLVVAILCTIAAFAINSNADALLGMFGNDQQTFDTLKMVVLGLAYASIIFTLFLDFFPIKKERRRMEDKARVQYKAKKKTDNTGSSKKKRDLVEYERKQREEKLAKEAADKPAGGSVVDSVASKIKNIGKKPSPKHTK